MFNVAKSHLLFILSKRDRANKTFNSQEQTTEGYVINYYSEQQIFKMKQKRTL